MDILKKWGITRKKKKCLIVYVKIEAHNFDWANLTNRKRYEVFSSFIGNIYDTTIIWKSKRWNICEKYEKIGKYYSTHFHFEGMVLLKNNQRKFAIQRVHHKRDA